VSARGVLLIVLVLAAAGGVAFLASENRAPDGGGGGGGSRERGETSRPGRLELLARLLDRRAQALERGDARAFAATSTGAQKARDRRSARRVRGLGVYRVALRADGGDVRLNRLQLRGQLAYRVRGIAGEFRAGQRLTIVWTGKDWRVRSARARRGRVPWEVTAQRRVRSRHFVVWAPRSIDVRGGGLVESLEAGYAQMRDVLARGRLRRRYLVVVAGTAGQARALTAEIRGIASLAAITDTEVRQEGDAERVVEIASQRLVVVWPAFRAVGPEAQRTVVSHELTHAAVAKSTSGRTPAWLVEGLALYVSEDDRVAEAGRLVVEGVERRALTLTGLSDPDVIAELGGSAQNAAYAYASAAAFYVAERFRQSALLDLYDVFNEESLKGASGSINLVDGAVRRVLKISLRRLERDLRQWILDRSLLGG
jgi:hypothetical protein